MNVFTVMAILWPKLKHRIPPKPYILCLLAVTFFMCLNAQGQFYKPSAISKEIGDALAASFFETVHQAVNAKTGEAATIKLADYKDKLIILDFWATWCGPCIGSLNKLDSMRTDMDTTGFIVFPVTYQKPKEAAPAFERFNWNMTSIISDTTLAQIFPHNGIPHQVWLKDGKVIAIPQYQNATAENIRAVLNGERVAMSRALKQIDLTKPYFMEGNSHFKYAGYHASLSTGDPQFAQQRLEFIQQQGRSILACFNMPLLNGLFLGAYRNEMHPLLTHNEGENAGLVITIPDSIRKKIQSKRPVYTDYTNPDSFMNAYNEIKKEYWYSYRLEVKVEITEDAALKIMQEDLNRYVGLKYGIRGEIQLQKRRFLVLQAKHSRAETEKLLKTKGGRSFRGFKSDSSYHLQNASYIFIRSRLQQTGIAPAIPLIDSTGIAATFKTDMIFTRTVPGSFQNTQAALAVYGLDLRLEDYDVPVLVIRPI